MAEFTDRVMHVSTTLIMSERQLPPPNESLDRRALMRRFFGKPVHGIACHNCGTVCLAHGLLEPDDNPECQCCGSERVSIEVGFVRKAVEGLDPSIPCQTLIVSAAMMLPCDGCGWKNHPESQFCGGCGEPLFPDNDDECAEP